MLVNQCLRLWLHYVISLSTASSAMGCLKCFMTAWSVWSIIRSYSVGSWQKLILLLKRPWKWQWAWPPQTQRICNSSLQVSQLCMQWGLAWQKPEQIEFLSVSNARDLAMIPRSAVSRMQNDSSVEKWEIFLQLAALRRPSQDSPVPRKRRLCLLRLHGRRLFMWKPRRSTQCTTVSFDARQSTRLRPRPRSMGIWQVLSLTQERPWVSSMTRQAQYLSDTHWFVWRHREAHAAWHWSAPPCLLWGGSLPQGSDWGDG